MIYHALINFRQFEVDDLYLDNQNQAKEFKNTSQCDEQ